MIRECKKFQIALVKGRDGFVGGLCRLESRSLYRPSSRYVELGTCWHDVRSYDRIWNDMPYERCLFCCRDRLLLLRLLFGGIPRELSFAARLVPLRRSFWIRFWVESLTCFAIYGMAWHHRMYYQLIPTEFYRRYATSPTQPLWQRSTAQA